jgi:hypothetical protein
MGYPSPEVVKRPTKGSYPEGSYEACQANQDPNINYFADPCRDLPMNNGLHLKVVVMVMVMVKIF